MWPGQCPFSALISSKCLPALFSWGGRSSRSQWMNGFQEKSRELIYSHSVSCSYLLSHITFKNIPVYVVLVKKTFCAVFLLNDFVIVFPIQFRKRGKHMRYTQNSETINTLFLTTYCIGHYFFLARNATLTQTNWTRRNLLAHLT